MPVRARGRGTGLAPARSEGPAGRARARDPRRRPRARAAFRERERLGPRIGIPLDSRDPAAVLLSLTMIVAKGKTGETDLQDDAEALHAAVSDLVRIYQLRDRNQICCYDISVTQCYALE